MLEARDKVAAEKRKLARMGAYKISTQRNLVHRLWKRFAKASDIFGGI